MSVRAAAVRAYWEGLPALGASVVGGLIAGVVLGGMRGELQAVPGLLVLIPALLATRGNVYGSLGARIATGLHQGLVEPRVTLGDKRLRRAVAAAIGNGLLASVFAATVVFLILTLFVRTPAPYPVLLGIALIAGLFSGITLSTLVVVLVFAGYRRGRDPDTLVGPIVTTAGDVFGLAFLVLAVRIVLGLGGGG
jgi:mgtE-like transporter